MLSIYIAARYERQGEMKLLAEILHKRGYRITSSWLECTSTDPMGRTLEEKVYNATQDIEDIIESNVLVFFSESPELATKRGGRHVEFGIALAYSIKIIVVGPEENIFHFADGVVHVGTTNTLLHALSELEDGKI